jgi:hypothetical protein
MLISTKGCGPSFRTAVRHPRQFKAINTRRIVAKNGGLSKGDLGYLGRLTPQAPLLRRLHD